MAPDRPAHRSQSRSRRRLLEVVGAPDVIEPWLDRFYDAADAELVLAVAEAPLVADQAVERPPTGVDADRLTRAWRRGVLDRREDGNYSPASFHARLEYWALFEGWQDVPDDVRGLVCTWEGAYYVDGLRERVAALKAGAALQPGERGAEYLLLHEAEALLRRAGHIYLWPCNCRAYVGGCRKPSLVCLRFENDRDTGWEISTERAVEIMREANRRGLMQVGEVAPGAGPISAGALCNCCSDCCFEQYASRELDAARVWPQSRYVAVLPDDCSRCGRCARRCPFGAVVMTGDGEPLPDETHRAEGIAAGPAHRPVLDTAHCRGCGVCATGCPDSAIVLRSLHEDVTARP